MYDDIPKPTDNYAKSKHEAESGLKEISDTVLHDTTSRRPFERIIEEEEEQDSVNMNRKLPSRRGSTLGTKARSGYRDSIALLYGKDSIENLHS